MRLVYVNPGQSNRIGPNYVKQLRYTNFLEGEPSVLQTNEDGPQPGTRAHAFFSRPQTFRRRVQPIYSGDPPYPNVRSEPGSKDPANPRHFVLLFFPSQTLLDSVQEPPQPQSSVAYTSSGGSCVIGSGLAPCSMSDYMTANSDYGVMLPMQQLPPLSPNCSPAHGVHPLAVLNGGLRMSPQHMAAHQTLHKTHGGPQPSMHQMPVMTNNSLYATGALSAALMLPQYPQPDPNHA